MEASWRSAPAEKTPHPRAPEAIPTITPPTRPARSTSSPTEPVERPMPKREELQNKQLPELATLCERVALDRSCESHLSDYARVLRVEWMLLMASNTPPVPELRKQMEKQQTSLKKRMVDFLA